MACIDTCIDTAHTSPMTTTRNYIATCKNGHAHAFEAAGFVGNTDCTETGCIQTMVAKPVRGKVSKIRCGAKCRNSLGPSCSCECGGHNHAEAFRAA